MPKRYERQDLNRQFRINGILNLQSMKTVTKRLKIYAMSDYKKKGIVKIVHTIHFMEYSYFAISTMYQCYMKVVVMIFIPAKYTLHRKTVIK